jgi:hypothetical protein
MSAKNNAHSAWRRYGWLEVAAGILAGALVAVATVLSVQMAAGGSTATTSPTIAPTPATSGIAAKPNARFADVRGQEITTDVRFIADWVADSGDANGMAFVIIDKKDAKVYVFDRDARLAGASPVLLGVAPGDDTVPGIGSRPLSQVLPEERTTPAGRFLGERGHNARGEDVVWVDYDAAVSMHRVLTTNPVERRLERLATPAVEDNRVSYGCVNVPVAFYEQFIRPTFAENQAVIYVLPEIKSIKQVFNNAYDVAATHGIDGADRSRAQRAPQHDAAATFRSITG